MSETEITKRLEEVATRIWTDGAYQKFVRPSDAQSVVEKMCDEMQTIIDKQTVQLAEQSAKIYAYEAILQNSNFKMAVVRKKEEK